MFSYDTLDDEKKLFYCKNFRVC